jgi:hypothetical protein
MLTLLLASRDTSNGPFRVEAYLTVQELKMAKTARVKISRIHGVWEDTRQAKHEADTWWPKIE